MVKIEMNVSEVWDLLKEGSTNQRNFIESLKFYEFEEFIKTIEDYKDFDLRGWINGGVLWVEDDPIQDYIIWKNERIAICLV